MKYLIQITIIISVVMLGACSKKDATPTDLEGYTKLLKEKKTELATLQDEIKEITEKVTELDTTLREKAKLIEPIALSATSFDRYIDIQGAVTADDPVNVVSEVAGRITMLKLKEGDYVKKGQLVATLDLESIDKQEAEINSALSLAKDVYERQSRLWDQKIGSEIQYLQAKNNVERLEKSLETLAFQKSKANVYAPISGAVDMTIMSQGEVVNPGMPILQILNTSNLKVSTDLPERYLKILKRGQMVDLSFPSLDLEIPGKVTLLGRRIDPANRTLKVEITPTKRSSLLKPNLLTEIKVKELSLDEVIIMPITYVLQEVDGTEFVHIVNNVNGETRAKKVIVVTGESADGNVVITEGLSADDIVIGQGSRNVRNGELVKTK